MAATGDLALMPVGISAGAGMTSRRCRRMAGLRESAALNTFPVEGTREDRLAFDWCTRLTIQPPDM